MEAVSKKAIDLVLKHEGGFVDHKNDPGGATKFGVSLRTLKAGLQIDPKVYKKFDLDSDGEITVADIKNLTEEEAKAYYKKFWWDKFNFSYIPIEKLAIKTFDLAVNMGPHRAIKMLQQSVTDVYPRSYLVEDGILGPQTNEALKEIEGNKDKTMNLYAIFILNVEMYYRRLIDTSPPLKAFLKGWINRLYDNEHIEQYSRGVDS